MKKVKIFNNLTRSKEELKTQVEGQVKFYSCGPTTYNFAHVGNARAFVTADLINRSLKALGYKVSFARNFTDVDDKIIETANARGIDSKVHAEEFVQECLIDMNELGMLKPDFMPRVTETMPEIVAMIEDIIKNGDAYVVDGEVLYHVPNKKDYGKLSKKKLEDLEHGIRVEVDVKKKHPSDFVLWKPAKPGEPSWNSPWSNGRPGWHIECSAMAKKHLGKTIDLHHGGVDLMFPHHENEIAQSESANKCPFCTGWVHNEFLNFGSEKMSKSLGNVVRIRDFTEKYSGLILRMVLLSVHYRARLDWSEEIIQKAIGDLERLYSVKQEWEEFKKEKPTGKVDAELVANLEKIIPAMEEELANDFNSAGALSNVFEFVRLVRRDIIGKKVFDQKVSGLVDAIFAFSDLSLGILGHDPKVVLNRLQKIKSGGQENKFSATEIEKMLEQRKTAKASKDFKESDRIRDELKAKGIIIKDNPDGTTSWNY
jgi:cysteinyl-tRNA synthetase